MQTDEIVQLTRKRMQELLRSRSGEPINPCPGAEKRLAPRWPFAGTVELWPEPGDRREPWLANLRNISETGLGMQCERQFDSGTVLHIAVHVPEASFCGKGIVRYCKEVRREFMVGLEFLFED